MEDALRCENFELEVIRRTRRDAFDLRKSINVKIASLCIEKRKTGSDRASAAGVLPT